MIKLVNPYFDEEEVDTVRQVLQSGWVTQGPKCEEFEEAVARYLKCKHVISVTNCTSALYLALKACNIGAGDEVIVPDYTFPATALAVLQTGAVPVFVDVMPLTYNINPGLIIPVISRKTKAIIPVHTFGQASPMSIIMLIAEMYELNVIEDAACALGSFFPQSMKMAGTIGDIGCFSLHARKGMTTGEGGLICTNNDEMADYMRKASHFGTERTYGRKSDPCFLWAGFNFKMSDITAAIGLVQLKRLDARIAKRQQAAMEMDKYIDANMPDVTPPVNYCHTGHSYQSYVCKARPGTRQEAVDHFNKLGLETGIGTYACHMHALFKGNGGFPVSKDLYENVISVALDC